MDSLIAIKHFAAQQRFRPIMLTMTTTTVGLVPLWIGGGINVGTYGNWNNFWITLCHSSYTTFCTRDV
jgi:hypothetical protein